MVFTVGSPSCTTLKFIKTTGLRQHGGDLFKINRLSVVCPESAMSDCY